VQAKRAMSVTVEGSPWATKAEASAQQARRFSQLRGTSHCELPPLPPLVRSHRESTPPPLEQTSLSSTSSAERRHHMAPQALPRASTAEAERLTNDGLAVPSISTLNREFDRLSTAYAGMRGDLGGVLPVNAATLHAGRAPPRRTSAPAAQRSSLAQRSRPDTGLRSPTATSVTHDDSSSQEQRDQRTYTEVSAGVASAAATPVLPRSRRASVGLPEVSPLPSSQAATLLRRRDINTPADHHSEATSKCSLPSPLSGPQPPVMADWPIRVTSPETNTNTSSAAQPTTTNAEDTAAKTNDPPAEEGEGGSPASRALPPPPPPRNTRQRKNSREAKSISPAPQTKGGKSRDGRITVVVRKRPLAADEAGPDCVGVNGPHIHITVTKQRVDLSNYEESSDYTFDHAFDAAASNSDVYNTSVKELLTVSLAGGSASCFAYGQTGSGKTYTMMGTDGESGLYLLAAGDLFGRLGAGQQLCVCFYEIYCNSLFDLLNRRHPIVLREDANRRVNICGVVWRTVDTVDELWQLVKAGMEQRRTGSTSANEHSSRSHAVLSIRIKDSAHLDFMGTINFVDLAGSERAADTAANDRLTRLEGAEINKSLLALKECIRALDEKKRHVPFRGSRLTEVLRDSFTGNSKTVMIATVSPSAYNQEHSNNTLRYAFRVKGLSIASVEPSKARNAPRPYIPVGRSRSGAGQDDAQHLSPVPSRNPQRSGSADDLVEGSCAASPTKQRQGRKRRHSRRKNRAQSTDISARGAAAVVNELAEMRERNSVVCVQARRNSKQRRNTSSMANHVSNPQDISSLLPQHPRQRRQVEDAALTSSQRAAHRPIYKAPPPNPLLFSSSERSSTSSTFNTSSSLRVNSVAQPPLRSPRASADLVALERRLTNQIMSQLRHDLGKQLEDVLTEKDATIAALQRENEALRKALDQAQGEAGRCGSTPSPQETEGRRTEGTVQPSFYPPSPSILHEQTSTGASLSSASDEGAYRVV
jgi:kinesin family member 2/24